MDTVWFQVCFVCFSRRQNQKYKFGTPFFLGMMDGNMTVLTIADLKSKRGKMNDYLKALPSRNKGKNLLVEAGFTTSCKDQIISQKFNIYSIYSVLLDLQQNQSQIESLFENTQVKIKCLNGFKECHLLQNRSGLESSFLILQFLVLCAQVLGMILLWVC